MKNRSRVFSLLLLIFLGGGMSIQAQILNGNDRPTCGHEFIENCQLNKDPEYSQRNHDFMLRLQKIIEHKRSMKTATDIYSIPVVFHVVYNNEEENIPDSVIFNQIEVLNACFRRTNEDASETREEFLDLVGDTQIEFYLADTDPSGENTNGIVRVETSVEHFGGVMPYNTSQTTEIINWVNEELFPNYFRITSTDDGGSSPWDPELYLNIWCGDLRIFEPEIDNFEELFYYGLATPPFGHENWPDELVGMFEDFNPGVLLHYVSAGGNNTLEYPSPYGNLNGSITRGKVLVHEVGHYLGLRHIWGDGNCSVDDYIYDTPKMSAASNLNCSFSANSCVDDIYGEDLPNMVENYMDYSHADCQNSFTIGQIELMQAVLEEFKPNLYEVTVSTQELTEKELTYTVFPNPFNEELHVDFPELIDYIEISVYDNLGKLVFDQTYSNRDRVTIQALLSKGFYVLVLRTKEGKVSRKNIVRY